MYAEELAVEAGYRGHDPALRLEQLKFRLRTVLNARLDVGAHCEGMSEAKALAMLQQDGFQEALEARGKWLRTQLTATQLSAYWIGLEEIRALEVADRNRSGASWSRRDFVSRLLSHGSLPVRTLAPLLHGAETRPGAAAVAAP